MISVLICKLFKCPLRKKKKKGEKKQHLKICLSCIVAQDLGLEPRPRLW